MYNYTIRILPLTAGLVMHCPCRDLVAHYNDKYTMDVHSSRDFQHGEQHNQNSNSVHIYYTCSQHTWFKHSCKHRVRVRGQCGPVWKNTRTQSVIIMSLFVANGAQLM